MKKLTAMLIFFVLAGCSGLNKTRDHFVATGHSFNLLFLQIPGDPLDLAENSVPKNAQVNTIVQTSNDPLTFPGFFHRLFGFGWAEISGTIENNSKKKFD